MNVEPNEFQKALKLLHTASICLVKGYTPTESPRKEIIAYLRKYPINNITDEPLDKNVEGVREQLKKRAEHGLAKYGVTTERKDVDLLGWLQHLQEELMDASVYIERLKSEVPEPIEIKTACSIGRIIFQVAEKNVVIQLKCFDETWITQPERFLTRTEAVDWAENHSVRLVD